MYFKRNNSTHEIFVNQKKIGEFSKKGYIVNLKVGKWSYRSSNITKMKDLVNKIYELLMLNK